MKPGEHILCGSRCGTVALTPSMQCGTVHAGSYPRPLDPIDNTPGGPTWHGVPRVLDVQNGDLGPKVQRVHFLDMERCKRV